MRNVKGMVITVVLAMALSFLLVPQVSQSDPPPNSLAGRVAVLEARVAALEAAEALSEFVTVDMGTINGLVGPHLIIEGANVHIRSGSGCTTDGPLDAACDLPIVLTGLGNLVVGYNEEPDFLADGDRGGSHNLIVGRQHKYSSFGGFVAGFENSITGQESSISGGEANVASGLSSSVSGGVSNGATGPQSSISGGFLNGAIGGQSSVLGGEANDATGVDSTVSGGGDNTASGTDSSVSGGFFNFATGPQSSISGGGENSAAATASSVSGGELINASVGFCWKAGTSADTC